MSTTRALSIASAVVSLAACADLTAPPPRASLQAQGRSPAHHVLDEAAVRGAPPPATALVSMLDDAVLLTAPDASRPMRQEIDAALRPLRVALATGTREESQHQAAVVLTRMHALSREDRSYAFELLAETLRSLGERLRTPR